MSIIKFRVNALESTRYKRILKQLQRVTWFNISFSRRSMEAAESTESEHDDTKLLLVNNNSMSSYGACNEKATVHGHAHPQKSISSLDGHLLLYGGDSDVVYIWIFHLMILEILIVHILL